MNKIRLYIDEDAVDYQLVRAYKNNGVDVMTTLEANRLTYSDEDQLIWATEQNRVVYTFNRRDFSCLHSEFLAAQRTHAGIILVQQQRYSVGEQLRGLLKLIQTKSSEDMINNLEYLGNYISSK